MMLHVGLVLMKVHEKDVCVLVVVSWKYSRAMVKVGTVDFVFECADNVEKWNTEELAAHG